MTDLFLHGDAVRGPSLIEMHDKLVVPHYKQWNAISDWAGPLICEDNRRRRWALKVYRFLTSPEGNDQAVANHAEQPLLSPPRGLHRPSQGLAQRVKRSKAP